MSSNVKLKFESEQDQLIMFCKTASQGSMFCKGLFHVSVFGIICRGGKTNTVVGQETATH